MSEGIMPGIKQFILPFSVLSDNRKEPFTVDLEVAAVFSLAEADRAKGGGFLSKRPEEDIIFIAKIGYPLWLFPWLKTAFIFDGFGRSKYKFQYAAIPDVKEFAENLKSGSKTRETHMAFLSEYINYFQAPVTEKGFIVNGLICDPEFLAEFDPYHREAKAIEDQPSSVAMLSPTIEEPTISSTLDELKTLYLSFKKDVDMLYRSMKFINQATRHYIKVLNSRTKAIKEEFDVKIKAQEELIVPRVAHLKEDYDHKIVQSAKSFEKKRLPVQKEKVKFEKSREHTLARIERCKLEAKTCAEKDDCVGEDKWKEKSSETKNELSEIENKLKDTEKTLKDLEEQKSIEIFNLRSELEGKIKELNKPLLELDSSRDAQILLHTQDIEKLEQQTKLITDHMGRTAKLRESSISNFSKLGIKQSSELKDAVLFYVPFYAICYQVDSKKRYLFLPPSEANAVGLSTKLKSALGKAKIKQLLTRRFDIITSLMDTIEVLAQQNVIFEKEMREMSHRTDILNMRSMRESIKKGLEYINKEGWLSEKEYQDLSQRIT